jgi:hypothetical protein
MNVVEKDIESMESKINNNEFDFFSLSGLEPNESTAKAFMRGYRKAIETMQANNELALLKLNTLLK